MIKNALPYVLLILVTVILCGYVAFFATLNPAGDIVEYYGTTQSILNHGGIDLTPQDQKNLEQSLHPGYFEDPRYYIKGVDGRRYSAHFTAYSVLSIPMRLFLRVANLTETKALALTNILILFIAGLIVIWKFLTSPFQKVVFLPVLFLSPLLSFLTWPGPDILFLSILLIAVFAFYKGKYMLASLLTALASWHSQPLIVLASGFFIFAIGERITRSTSIKQTHIRLDMTIISISVLFVVILLIPFLYNYILFGVLTPWTTFADGWTKLYGFGLHNASLTKLFEQFFDLDMGLFWYAPALLATGIYYLLQSARGNKRQWVVAGLIIITAFFYQTNPAWHYGTAGYGPTRHVMYVIPFLIYFVVTYLKPNLRGFLLLSLIVISQLAVLSFNGFITPNFERSLYHDPIATFVLNRYPQWYNPTPEIFVDRTNHTDFRHITTAIYKVNGKCKKAYILKTEVEMVKKECGDIPTAYQSFEGVYVNF